MKLQLIEGGLSEKAVLEFQKVGVAFFYDNKTKTVRLSVDGKPVLEAKEITELVLGV